MLTMTLLALLLPGPSASPETGKEWSLCFRGTIGNLQIEMEPDRSSLGISGSYRYQRSRERLLLESDSLHAEDNGQCGGAGVSFSDDYS